MNNLFFENFPVDLIYIYEMATLFKPVTTKITYMGSDGKTPVDFPDLLQPNEAEAALSDAKISEITGLKTVEIKNAVANLARTNYEAYVTYKEKMWGTVKQLVIDHYKASALRWKQMGYTDDDALMEASKSSKRYKEELEDWYNSLFSAPKQGAEVKKYY